MEAYINKKDKHAVMVVPLDAKMQDGYIVINNGVVEWKEKKAFEDLYEEEPNYSEPVLDEKLAGIFDSLYVVNENIDKYKHKDTTLIYSTPTDEEIKQSEKELNEDLKKHDKYIGFYCPDSISQEVKDNKLGVNCECKTLEKFTKIKPKITLTDKSALYKEALNYYNENCKGDFEAAVTPLLIYLSKEHSPMTKAIVESDKAELVEGIKSIVNDSFLQVDYGKV